MTRTDWNAPDTHPPINEADTARQGYDVTEYALARTEREFTPAQWCGECRGWDIGSMEPDEIIPGSWVSDEGEYVTVLRWRPFTALERHLHRQVGNDLSAAVWEALATAPGAPA